MKMIIGITGGIGSGKTTVTDFYSQLGYFIIKADNVAKQIMVEDKDLVHKIIDEFGEKCYGDNGELDTKYLAQSAFSHPKNLEKLNKIVHPPAILKVKQIANNALKEHNLVFVESALIFEAKMEEIFDYIILITADEDTRIKRVLERGNETAFEIKSRMMHQLSEADKQKRSDFIIKNDSTIEELKKRAEFILSLINSLTSKQ